ncbi:hypothetical protein Tco_1431186 [Tanacetum coccineum]
MSSNTDRPTLLCDNKSALFMSHKIQWQKVTEDARTNAQQDVGPQRYATEVIQVEVPPSMQSATTVPSDRKNSSISIEPEDEDMEIDSSNKEDDQH